MDAPDQVHTLTFGAFGTILDLGESRPAPKRVPQIQALQHDDR